MADDNLPTLTDKSRQSLRMPLDRIGRWLARLGARPDSITVLGLLLVGVAAVYIGTGDFLAGGVLLLLSLPLDAIDGAVARAIQRQGSFGMVLDSTLDRYADGFIFAAFGYHFARHGRLDMLMLALFSLIGSYLVSYVRARADDSKVGIGVTVGWFSRLERVAVILVMTLAAGVLQSVHPLEIGLVILAVGTNLTALQRLRYVYTALKNRGE
ncbi:MAG: CDP-alcohol phosphatidyltransferase family protein [Chloroflexota bacterium]|nr:CDP-alcohol phosphatidyltransferase family protein [Chloroflexota bacterium]